MTDNFRKILVTVLWGLAFIWALSDNQLRALWPSVVALGTALLLKRVLIGLFAGGMAGAIILANGNLAVAFVSLFRDHLIPLGQSPWKVGAILFTFMLGGFAAIIEKGGGLQALVKVFLYKGRDPSKRVQLSGFILGVVCFFDGLANSMMVGRMLRSLADQCGVSRVKMAYIVDSTSSAVACLAFVSTWIAYQLGMIREGYAQLGLENQVQPYALFFRSIPYNFYCWFTIVLLPVAIYKNFNPGPMKKYEMEARTNSVKTKFNSVEDNIHWAVAVIPVFILLISIFLGMYLNGAKCLYPVTFKGIADAFGNANSALVLVCASAVASLAAFLCFPKRVGQEVPSKIYLEGMQSLFLPILILIGAWVLASTLEDLKAAEVLSLLLTGRFPVFLLPTTVFLIGALISFSTGSSWGTMGILMPLSIPVAITITGSSSGQYQELILATVVAAVFSGAVFGDHCSPISDTTIVASISCEVEPHDHVRTQLPYALIAAIITIAIGFVPVGLGIPIWVLLLMGTLIIWITPDLLSRFKKIKDQ